MSSYRATTSQGYFNPIRKISRDSPLDIFSRDIDNRYKQKQTTTQQPQRQTTQQQRNRNYKPYTPKQQPTQQQQKKTEEHNYRSETTLKAATVKRYSNMFGSLMSSDYDYDEEEEQQQQQPTQQQQQQPTQQQPTQQQPAQVLSSVPYDLLIDCFDARTFECKEADKHVIKVDCNISIDSVHLYYYIAEKLIKGSYNISESLKISNELTILCKRIWNLPIEFVETPTNIKLFEAINETKRPIGCAPMMTQLITKIDVSKNQERKIIKNIDCYKLFRAIIPRYILKRIDLENTITASAESATAKVTKSIAEIEFIKMLDLYRPLLINAKRHETAIALDNMNTELAEFKENCKYNKISTDEYRKKETSIRNKYANSGKNAQDVKTILKNLFFFFRFSGDSITRYLVLSIVNLGLYGVFDILAENYGKITNLTKEDKEIFNEWINENDEDTYNDYIKKFNMKKETLTNIYAIHFNELLIKILENIRDFKLNKFDIVIYDNNYRNIIIEYIMKYHFEEMRDNISSFKLVESKDVKDIKNETALKKEIKISLNKFKSETSAEYRNRYINMYPQDLIISCLFTNVHQDLFATTFFPLLIELCNVSEKNNEMIFEQWNNVRYTQYTMAQNLFKWMLVKHNETRYQEVFTRIDNTIRKSTGCYYSSIFEESAPMTISDKFFANIERFIKNKEELTFIYNFIDNISKDLEKFKIEEEQRNNKKAFNTYKRYAMVASDILEILKSKFYRI